MRSAILLFAVAAMACGATPSIPFATTEARIDALVAQMTLEEKVGQMVQYLPPSQFPTKPPPKRQDDETVPEIYRGLTKAQILEQVRAGRIGSFLNFYGDSIAEGNELQKAALESRLGIPLLFGADAIHGHAMTAGTTVFPVPIGLAATFDEELVRKTSVVTAAEMRATGFQWCWAPNVEVVRDQRWGRVNETFGEDPFLVARMGVATVQGLQGDLKDASTTVVACAKHFIGGSQPIGGQNHAPADFSERTLREVFLPPFTACIEAGVVSVMIAHNEVNGVPCHANSALMTDLLKGELGFRGLTVSDWLDVSRLATTQRIARDKTEASELATLAGLDVNMHGPGFFEAVVAGVQAGRIPMARIDDAVRRILRVKFAAGVFEHPYADRSLAARQLATPEHMELALEAARKSVVLLRNEKNILPLAPTVRKIFVTGPNATDSSPLGDWSTAKNADRMITMLDGVRQVFGPNIAVDSLECGRFDQITDETIRAAAERARQAEVAVLFVGGKPWRGAGPGPVTEGENYDRFELGLPGRQLELVKAVHATGVPTVVVLLNGGAICEPWLAEHIDGLVEAFYPGQQGGRAVAEILAGKLNPSGRLPYTIVRGASALPGYYYQRPGFFAAQSRFADLGQERSKTPLFPFGFGLSYTTYTYANLRAPASLTPGQDFDVTVDVQNTGGRAGEEVVLLYVSDLLSSVTMPVKLLKAFQRVHLEPGERKTVTLRVPAAALELLDVKLRPVIEPGEFAFTVGTERFVATVKKP